MNATNNPIRRNDLKATDKQKDLIRDLVGEIEAEYRKTLDDDFVDEMIEGYRESYRVQVLGAWDARGAASHYIEMLLANKANARSVAKTLAEAGHARTDEAPATETSEVPDGRYALGFGNGVVKFYKVNTPTAGKWAGYTFVEAQASEETFPIRNAAKRREILSAIAEDVRGAAALYGTELGVCGRCGRTLTDDDSRARGIGPVCADKF